MLRTKLMREQVGTFCVAGIACTVVAATLMSGCGGGGGAAAATVSGFVSDDATLQALAGVEVTCGAASATSASNGGFTLDTASGTRTIVFSANDYEGRELNAALNAGANNLGTIHLRPALLPGNGSVQGTVRRVGAAVAAAMVESGNAEAVSKANGNFFIANVASGERVLAAVSPDAQHAGYAVVQVAAGETTTGVTIDLNLGPPAPPIL